jgi:hypothetical protein
MDLVIRQREVHDLRMTRHKAQGRRTDNQMPSLFLKMRAVEPIVTGYSRLPICLNGQCGWRRRGRGSDAQTFSLYVLYRPFTMCGDVPEQTLCGRDEQTVVWVVYGQREEAKEGESCAEGGELDEEPEGC